MKIAPIILSSVVLCLVYANTAQSFKLTQKLVAVKEPIIAAKLQFARDVKDKVVEVTNQVCQRVSLLRHWIEYKSIAWCKSSVSNWTSIESHKMPLIISSFHPQAFLLKKKAATAIVTPIIAVKDWKKALLRKKLAAIAGPIIALKNLKRSIIEKKLNTLAKIIPTAASFGLGGLSQTPEGYAFTEWNGTPFQANDANSFVLVPEEYTNYHVEDSAAAARTFGQSGDFVQSTLANTQSTLESIGNHIPFFNTLTNGVNSFKQSLHPKPVYQWVSKIVFVFSFAKWTRIRRRSRYNDPFVIFCFFYRFVPNLGFHQYHNIHYEPSVPVNVPTVPESVETSKFELQPPKETYGPPSPYPPPVPELPEVPHIEYGVPSTTTTVAPPPSPPTDTYGPPSTPPTDTYGPPPTYGLPSTFSSQSFQIPKTSYGVPQGPAFQYIQRWWQEECNLFGSWLKERIESN